MKKNSFVLQIITFLFTIAIPVGLWLFFSPGADWQNIRYACYLTYAVFFFITAAYPVAGLFLFGFSVPLLSVIPLYLTKGSPYPIILFAGYAFVSGRFLNQIIKKESYRMAFGFFIICFNKHYRCFFQILSGVDVECTKFFDGTC